MKEQVDDLTEVTKSLLNESVAAFLQTQKCRDLVRYSFGRLKNLTVKSFFIKAMDVHKKEYPLLFDGNVVVYFIVTFYPDPRSIECETFKI